MYYSDNGAVYYSYNRLDVDSLSEVYDDHNLAMHHLYALSGGQFIAADLSASYEKNSGPGETDYAATMTYYPNKRLGLLVGYRYQSAYSAFGGDFSYDGFELGIDYSFTDWLSARFNYEYSEWDETYPSRYTTGYYYDNWSESKEYSLSVAIRL